MFFCVREREREREFLTKDTFKEMPSQFGVVERGNVKNVLPSGKKKMSQQLANTGLNKKIKCKIV